MTNCTAPNNVSSTNLAAQYTNPAEPAAGGTVPDPVFNCGTNYRLPGSPAGNVTIPEYSTRAVENTDGTLALLYSPQGGGWALYDAAAKVFLKYLSGYSSDAGATKTDHNFEWAKSTAIGTAYCSGGARVTLFYTNGTKLRYYCSDNDARGLIHDFSTHGLNPKVSDCGMLDEGQQSDNDRYWVLTCYDAYTGGQYDVLGYDRQYNVLLWHSNVTTMSNGGFAQGTIAMDNAKVAPVETRLAIAWNKTGSFGQHTQGVGVDEYDMLTGSFLRNFCSGATHADTARGTDGDYYVNGCRGVTGASSSDYKSLTAYRFSDGAEFVTILGGSTSNWNYYMNCCWHVSGIGSRGPNGTRGTVLLSTYTPGSRFPSTTGWGNDEMIVVRFQDKTWQRIGQQWNADAASGDNTCSIGHAGYDCSYWGQTKAVPTPGYTRVYWGTTFLSTAHQPHVYVKELGGSGPAPDFSIAASPGSLAVAQGSAGAATITSTLAGTFNNAVALTATGAPSGVTVTFSPSSLTAPGSGSSTMNLGVAASVPAGTYPITVTAAGGGITHTTTVSLTVTAAGSTSIALVGSWPAKHANGGTSITITGPATTAGNFLAVFFSCGSATANPTVADNRGNSYKLALKAYDILDSRGAAWIYYLENIPAGISSLTLTFAYDRADVVVREYRGVAAIGSLDQTATRATGYIVPPQPYAWSSGTVAVGTGNELLLGVLGQHYISSGLTTWGTGAGWTDLVSSNDQFLAMDRVAASAGTYQASGTLSDTLQTGFRFAVGVATFRAAAP